MTIKYAEQKIYEARQRLTALDHALADLRRQTRTVASSPDTRIALLVMREELARLGEERIKAYAELVELGRSCDPNVTWRQKRSAVPSGRASSRDLTFPNKREIGVDAGKGIGEDCADSPFALLQSERNAPP